MHVLRSPSSTLVACSPPWYRRLRGDAARGGGATARSDLALPVVSAIRHHTSRSRSGSHGALPLKDLPFADPLAFLEGSEVFARPVPQENANRLKGYKTNLVLFPRRNKKPKAGDSSPEELSKVEHPSALLPALFCSCMTGRARLH